MKTQRSTAAQQRRQTPPQDWSPQGIGLEPELYAAALRYLFDRQVPATASATWAWDPDEPEFDATPLQWTRVQTALFANAGSDLAGYGDEQVGMGLDYVMNNSISDVPFAAIDPSVPLDDAMKMMRAMPALWRDCIGPRLAHLKGPGGISGSRLDHVSFMWFDVWPTFWHVRAQPVWQEAVWQVLRDMLEMPCRAVQLAALHGIGHQMRHLDRQREIDNTVVAFIRSVDPNDTDLKNYAEAARQGMVQ
ncbi:hypothetical protein ACS5PN_10600 [Roseateles sp. NT4]|uniref:hypothetical protein n=1 Tax=Roseateles sp. NT4 TaxID=3453715 RepID=UPI003EEB9F65